MSNAPEDVEQPPVVATCVTCHDLWLLRAKLQHDLDAAELQNTQLRYMAWCQDCRYDQLFQQYQINEITLKNVAAEQSQRQKEFDDQKAQLATEIKIVEQSLRHEFKCHENTEDSLSHEREKNAQMLAILYQRHLPHPLGIPNPEIDAIRREAGQMKERLRSNASVIECLRHTVGRFQKEKEEMGQTLATKDTELLALQEELTRFRDN